MCQALDEQLDGRVTYSREPAGLKVLLRLERMRDETDVIRQAAAAGVAIYGGQSYHIATPHPSILLGFSGVKSAEIVEGIGRLAPILCDA